MRARKFHFMKHNIFFGGGGGGGGAYSSSNCIYYYFHKDVFLNLILNIQICCPNISIEFHNTPTGHLKKLVLNAFDKEKYLLRYENLQLYLKLRLKLK